MSLFHIHQECCKYPYILIPSGANRDDLRLEALRIHNSQHRISQKSIGLLKWLWKYYTEHTFRWKEEQLAFSAEIRFYRSRRCYVYLDAFADLLTFGYLNMCTIDEAKKFINQI